MRMLGRMPIDNSSAPKSFWEKLIGMTPVFLTVVATLLAGLSSSEMTQAQFYRSLAAQQQSKAGDQWNFFQAKRIRGTNLELAADLLPAAGDVGPEALVTALERLRIACERVRKQRDSMLTLAAGADGLDPYVHKALEAHAGEMGTHLDLALQSLLRLSQSLPSEDAHAAFTLLAKRTLPREPSSQEHPAEIKDALKAIAGRTLSNEIRERIARIPPEEVRQAMDANDAEALAFIELAKPIVRRAEKFGDVVSQADRAIDRCCRAARELRDMDGIPPSLRGAVDACLASAQIAKTLADELDRDFKAARHEYTAKSYEREARINQVLAGLYEIQVTRSDVFAERHRARSRLFFYGMLASQAGVTIASLALAVKQKSVLWSTATIAGVGALLFSAYVYLYF